MFKFVFTESNKDESVTLIDSYSSLENELGINIFEDENFCYLGVLKGIGSEHNDIDVGELLAWVLDYEDEAPMLSFSVTSLESRYDDWLIAASLWPGASICLATQQHRSGSRYTVAHVCIPTAVSYKLEN